MLKESPQEKSQILSDSENQTSTKSLHENTGRISHSHSRLQVFSSCPLAYRLTYIDKVPTESSDALEIGAAAHEFFERWVKSYVPSDDQIKEYGGHIELVASKCFQKEARNQSNFKEYLEICQTFAKSYKPDPAYPKVLSEQQWAFDRNWKPCAWMAPEARFRMKVDRIEEPDQASIKKIRICDYKAGWAGQIDSFQLDCYALGASIVYPDLDKVEVEFFYVRSGFKQVKILEVKDLDITKVQLEALMDRIEGEAKWKPKPGAKCLNCPVAAHCTAKPSDLKAISSKIDAQALATEIAFLEAQAKAKKKPLNAYCQAQGPVEAGGLVWAHRPTESLVVDIGPFLAACVQFQLDPAEMLNPDSTAIKKAMKKVPGFQEAITPYLGVDVGSRFSAKKSEGDDE